MRILPNTCEHKSVADFSRLDGDVRVWRCSGCGRESPWSDAWSYYGDVECARCWCTTIEWVACSPACALPTPDAKVPHKPPEKRAKEKRKRTGRGCSRCGKPGHYAKTCGRTRARR